MEFKTEIADIRARIRQERPPRVPDALNVPLPPATLRPPDDNSGGVTVPIFPIFPLPHDDDKDMFEQMPNRDFSNEEDDVDGDGATKNDQKRPKSTESLFDRRICIFADATKIDQKRPKPTESLLENDDIVEDEIQGIIFEVPRETTTTHFSNFADEGLLPNGETCSEIAELESETCRVKLGSEDPLTNGEICDGEDSSSVGEKGERWISLVGSAAKLRELASKEVRKALITVKTIRRVLNFKESIMKYGVFVPRNDSEADASPEHHRWESGRMLEWMRLQEQGTFERNWDWPRIQKKFPIITRGTLGMYSSSTTSSILGSTGFGWFLMGHAKTQRPIPAPMLQRPGENQSDYSTFCCRGAMEHCTI
jgi:hypothetical protein